MPQQSPLTLGLASTRSRLVGKLLRSRLGLYQMPSDAFFAHYSPTALVGTPIEMAFLDGLHRCEYLLRDFINTERHCKPNSIVALHDCLPVEAAITGRMEKYEISAHPARYDDLVESCRSLVLDSSRWHALERAEFAEFQAQNEAEILRRARSQPMPAVPGWPPELNRALDRDRWCEHAVPLRASVRWTPPLHEPGRGAPPSR